MVQINCLQELFESIPGYGKIVLLMFLVKSNIDILHEFGFLKNDKNRLCLEFKNILIVQNKDYLD